MEREDYINSVRPRLGVAMMNYLSQIHPIVAYQWGDYFTERWVGRLDNHFSVVLVYDKAGVLISIR
jgi:hypothetical protein